MTNWDYMWLRDHVQDLIKSLGFKQGHLPEGWQPKTALEVDVHCKILAICHRLADEDERRSLLPDYSNYPG